METLPSVLSVFNQPDVLFRIASYFEIICDLMCARRTCKKFKEAVDRLGFRICFSNDVPFSKMLSSYYIYKSIGNCQRQFIIRAENGLTVTRDRKRPDITGIWIQHGKCMSFKWLNYFKTIPVISYYYNDTPVVGTSQPEFKFPFTNTRIKVSKITGKRNSEGKPKKTPVAIMCDLSGYGHVEYLMEEMYGKNLPIEPNGRIKFEETYKPKYSPTIKLETTLSPKLKESPMDVKDKLIRIDLEDFVIKRGEDYTKT